MSFGMGDTMPYYRSGGIGSVSVSGGITVNSSGYRFVDESLSLYQTSYLVHGGGAQEDFGRNLWTIGTTCTALTATNPTNNQKAAIAAYRAIGALVGPCNSLTELCQLCGIDETGLRKQIADWNNYCTNVNPTTGTRLDLDFGRTLNASQAVNLNATQWFAKKYSCGSVLASVSGLIINENCQVLDYNDKPIPGLYAGGNCSGGFFYGNYPRNISGVSVGRAMTFGYLSAKHACTGSI